MLCRKSPQRANGLTLAFTIAGPRRPFSRQARIEELVGGAAEGSRLVESAGGVNQEGPTHLLVALE